MIHNITLPNPQGRALDLVKEVATEKDCHPFLVGGPVRDLLLGRKAIDVDLTLEEGSSTLARALAKRVDGRVRSFPQFLTYKVTADGFPEIDIATARKERYRAPGALPAVAPGKLEDDLLRRDFSINAMAVDLLSGSLHDPTNGEHDLKSGVIRVLHDKSFVDDPTRIFRAIRLARRLGFALESHTCELMDAALRAGALQTVSKERIWRELFLAMDEPATPSVLMELDHRGVLAHIFGKPVAPKTKRLLERVRHQIDSAPELDRYVLYTGALLRGIDISPAQLEGSGLSQKRAGAVLQIARELPQLEQALRGTRSDEQRFRLYKNVPAEVLHVLAADRPAEAKHLARFAEFQKFKLPLRGNDLEVPGGPHVAKALERTREAVFTGEIKPEEARSFAREMAIKYLEAK